MRTIKYMLLLLVGAFAFQSCGDLEDVNVDPTRLSDVSLSLLLPKMEATAAFNYGTNPGRVAGIWMQQFEGIDAQQLAHNRYFTPEDAMNNYWRTGLYVGTLAAGNVIIEKAVAEEAPFYSGVAKILMANELGLATSYFGDIPYSEAFKGTDNLKPAYDDSESIMNVVFTLLDEGISEVAGGGYVAGDLIYGGNAASWIKTAEAFRARYYLMLGKKDGGNYAKALAAVGQSFSSSLENCSFGFETSQTANWSLDKFGIERPGTIGFNPNFAAMLAGDPRLPLYAVDGAFHVSGNTTLTWAQGDARIPLVSYTELMFIKAECEARAGADATASLSEAISASMGLVGVSDTAAIASYVSSASGDGSVENIVSEAYKAYYGFNFHQTWSNWRRTGFPALSPVGNAAGDFNPSQSIPQRYLYVDSESTTNSENVLAAKARQDGALLDAKLWIFE